MSSLLKKSIACVIISLTTNKGDERRCMSANREYKSSTFTNLFHEKDHLLELYNAVSNSNLPPDTEISFTDLDDTLFTSMRNDLAFVVAGKLVVVIEH